MRPLHEPFLSRALHHEWAVFRRARCPTAGHMFPFLSSFVRCSHLCYYLCTRGQGGRELSIRRHLEKRRPSARCTTCIVTLYNTITNCNNTSVTSLSYVLFSSSNFTSVQRVFFLLAKRYHVTRATVADGWCRSDSHTRSSSRTILCGAWLGWQHLDSAFPDVSESEVSCGKQVLGVHHQTA